MVHVSVIVALNETVQVEIPSVLLAPPLSVQVSGIAA